MQFNTLKAKTKRVTSKQVGRGGTRGKTAGRGTKGQNARAGHKNRPELRDFIKRFPKLRGRGVSSFKSIKKKNAPVNLGLVEKSFSAGEIVSPKTLFEKKLLSSKDLATSKVKILGTGILTKKLDFENVIVSVSAKVVIEKLGGSIK